MTSTAKVHPDMRVPNTLASEHSVLGDSGWSHGDGGAMFRRRTTAMWMQAVDDWSAWMTSQNRSPQTIRQWRWKLRRLSEAYLNRSPWKLSTEDLYTWYGSQGWAPGSRKSARSALCSFYGWAKESGRTKRNPAAELHGVAISTSQPRPARDMAVTSALARGTDKERLMILLGDREGMRCGEIAQCRWEDIGDEMLLVHGKGGHERYVPLNEELAAELAAEWARRQAGGHGTGWHYTSGGDTFVFPGRDGGPMAARWISQQVSAVLGKGVTAHQLRHRYATRLLAETGNLRLVQQCLGHRSPDTTQIYAKVPDATLIAAVRAISF